MARGCGSRGLGVSGEPSQDPAALPLLTGVPRSPSTSTRQGEGPASTVACASAPGEPDRLQRHPPSSGSTGTGRPPGAPQRQPAGEAAPGSCMTQQSCRASGSMSPGSPVRVPTGGRTRWHLSGARTGQHPLLCAPAHGPATPSRAAPTWAVPLGPVLPTCCPCPLGSRRGGWTAGRPGQWGRPGAGLCAHRGDPCLRAAAPPTREEEKTGWGQPGAPGWGPGSREPAATQPGGRELPRGVPTGFGDGKGFLGLPCTGRRTPARGPKVPPGGPPPGNGVSPPPGLCPGWRPSEATGPPLTQWAERPLLVWAQVTASGSWDGGRGAPGSAGSRLGDPVPPSPSAPPGPFGLKK